MQDEFFMREAISLARSTEALGEVPVGAVVVLEGQIVGRGFNAPIGGHRSNRACRDRCAARCRAAPRKLPFAGLRIVRDAGAVCDVCRRHFALRASCVVYGARDPKTGVHGSVVDLFVVDRLNHHTEIVGGVLADEVRSSVDFFCRASCQTGAVDMKNTDIAVAANLVASR